MSGAYGNTITHNLSHLLGGSEAPSEHICADVTEQTYIGFDFLLLLTLVERFGIIYATPCPPRCVLEAAVWDAEQLPIHALFTILAPCHPSPTCERCGENLLC